VVRINAAVTGWSVPFVVGKRIGYDKESFGPHSLTLTMVGAAAVEWAGLALTPARRWK
jgi:Amt family ammonium transporter